MDKWEKLDNDDCFHFRKISDEEVILKSEYYGGRVHISGDKERMSAVGKEMRKFLTGTRMYGMDYEDIAYGFFGDAEEGIEFKNGIYMSWPNVESGLAALRKVVAEKGDQMGAAFVWETNYRTILQFGKVLEQLKIIFAGAKIPIFVQAISEEGGEPELCLLYTLKE